MDLRDIWGKRERMPGVRGADQVLGPCPREEPVVPRRCEHGPPTLHWGLSSPAVQ